MEGKSSERLRDYFIDVLRSTGGSDVGIRGRVDSLGKAVTIGWSTKGSNCEGDLIRSAITSERFLNLLTDSFAVKEWFRCETQVRGWSQTSIQNRRLKISPRECSGSVLELPSFEVLIDRVGMSTWWCNSPILVKCQSANERTFIQRMPP